MRTSRQGLQVIKKIIMDQQTSSSSTKIKQPEWKLPTSKNLKDQPGLKIYNTLTRSKTEFVPLNNNLVTWYSCGPTVYNAAHLGHARNYVTIDINRRVLRDYFGYNIFFVQNVTDIDDKIILQARQNFLFEEFAKSHQHVSVNLIETVKQAIAKYIGNNFDGQATSIDQYKDYRSKVDIAKEKEIKPKLPMHIRAVDDAVRILDELEHNNDAASADVKRFLESTKSVLLPLLDEQNGSSVNDPKVFRQTAAYWEADFEKDMKRLNVLPPSLTTRVSEYIPEIITFIQRIIDNGFAYQAKDGVYFDTVAFENDPNHVYAKLQPWNKGKQELIDEGEGSLSTGLQGKKSKNDFALWKASKPGEPEWPSQWGLGRPGWHIECSVMATDVLGEEIDIHSGGIDLAFPHHDNEIAQSEACLQRDNWVNYFMHTGHLHIEGQKMSKSLKNFITIQEALEKYTPRQLRLAFAMQQWNNNFDFKTELHEVKSVETMLNNFFRNVKALCREATEKEASRKAGKSELDLYKQLHAAQRAVHEAFCDNLTVPDAVQAISELVQGCNNYISAQKSEIKVEVLAECARWISKILDVLGFETSSDGLGWSTSDSSNKQQQQTVDTEELIFPYIQALSQFRDFVRSKAIARAPAGDFLIATDELRNDKLLDLGVSLDDRSDGQPALIKFLSQEEKQELIKQRDEKIRREQEKAERKKKQQELEAQKQAEKLEKAKIAPEALFKDSTDEYSQFDERGIPIADKEGKPLSKSLSKKLTKQWEAQKKAHEAYLNSIEH